MLLKWQIMKIVLSINWVWRRHYMRTNLKWLYRLFFNKQKMLRSQNSTIYTLKVVNLSQSASQEKKKKRNSGRECKRLTFKISSQVVVLFNISAYKEWIQHFACIFLLLEHWKQSSEHVSLVVLTLHMHLLIKH